MNNVYGFNADLIRQSIGKLNSAYEELTNALYGEMQNKFINQMSREWACEYSQRFFNASLKPSIDQLLGDSFVIFQSVSNAMDNAAASWAQQTGSAYSRVGFNYTRRAVDVSMIMLNFADGSKGITASASQTANASLTAVSASCDAALARAVAAVQTSGFIGGNQANDLISALNKIKTNINNSFELIKSETNSAISNTVRDYTVLASSVETNFSA